VNGPQNPGQFLAGTEKVNVGRSVEGMVGAIGLEPTTPTMSRLFNG